MARARGAWGPAVAAAVLLVIGGVSCGGGKGSGPSSGDTGGGGGNNGGSGSGSAGGGGSSGGTAGGGAGGSDGSGGTSSGGGASSGGSSGSSGGSGDGDAGGGATGGGAGGSGGGSGGTVGGGSGGSGSTSACDGMMPGALGAPVEVHIDGGQACGGATSHPSGGAALAAELYSPEGETWFPYSGSGSAAGPSMGSLDNNGVGRDTYFHPVTNGFRGIVILRPTPTVLDYRLRTWDLAGQLVSDLALQARRIAPLPDGGSLAVLAPPTPSSPGSAPGNPSLAWIDAAGHVTRTVPFDNDVGEVIVNWPTGHIFASVGGLSFRPAQGRWYDAGGSPLSPWFDLPIGTGGGYERLLADGVVVVGNIGGPWLTAVRDGAAGTEAVPAWLAARPGTRLATIRGGRGYAVLPASGMDSFEIVAADGESCGTVTVPQPNAQIGGAGWSPPRLDVGWDGTVFQTFLNQSPASPPPSPQRCVYRWWPGLLE